MSKLIKSIRSSCRILSGSEKRLEDIYSIICSHGDTVMAESSTMTRKLTYTYRQAQRDTLTVARAIKETLGRTGGYIGLHGENGYTWIVLFWAILQSGNKPYLINLRQPVHFTTGILQTLKSEYVISCEACPDYGITSYTYSELLEKGKDLTGELNVTFGNEFALSTSGTTLQEKICIYSGYEISQQILNVEAIIKENPEIAKGHKNRIKMLAFLPLYHIFGLEAMYLWFAFAGSTFVFLTDLTPTNILRTASYHEVTHVFAVPLLWHAVEKGLRQELATRDEDTRRKFGKAAAFSLKLQNLWPRLGALAANKMFRDVQAKLLGTRINFCISGGSAVKKSTIELLNSIGYHLCNGYGMSEVGITSVDLSRKPKALVCSSIGKPFSSVSYRIGNDGQLLIKGDSLCQRIIIDGTEQDMPEWFDTGDVVHIDEAGRYYIEGRISDIVFGDDGENLNPDFAEQVFSLRDVCQFSVLGNEDNTKLMLVVRIPEGIMEFQKERLKEEIRSCNEKLPMSYRVHLVKCTYDPLMDEKAIKVSRTYLRKAISENKVRLFDIDGVASANKTGEDSEIKSVLRGLFAKALGTTEDKITDTGHFMNDLGGSSLDYFTLISYIDEKFGVRLNFESNQFDYSLNDFEKIIEEMMK